MLYIVVRRIEPIENELKHDYHTFVLLEDAKRYYAESERLCWDGPDGPLEESSLIVTNCWLWRAHGYDPVVAMEMVHGDRADLLSVCFPPEKE
jgi:hypothetical protein